MERITDIFTDKKKSFSVKFNTDLLTIGDCVLISEKDDQGLTSYTMGIISEFTNNDKCMVLNVGSTDSVKTIFANGVYTSKCAITRSFMKGQLRQFDTINKVPGATERIMNINAFTVGTPYLFTFADTFECWALCTMVADKAVSFKYVSRCTDYDSVYEGQITISPNSVILDEAFSSSDFWQAITECRPADVLNKLAIYRLDNNS